ncbi:hypothetical protein [Cellulomonas marina]|uniref:hypothetical protein n=1 Tax=Cellulomonas marina TaxID=988821 RepID=UPI000B7C8520|nr:hypothetical protein [Cellulomonas marina]
MGRESTTFGFSILVTVTFGLLQAEEGSPDTIRIVLYAVGASLSFTVLEAVLSRGFRTAMPQHRTRVLALGTSMNVLSVLGGLGAAWLLARATSHVTVWLVAPFVAGIVYLVLESLETAWGERVARARGDDDATEVEG